MGSSMPIKLGDDAPWKEMENSRNSDLADLLRRHGLPTAEFERIFPFRAKGRRSQRKPDVSVVDGDVHLISGKYGNKRELQSVTSAQEYREDLGPELRRHGKVLGEVFGVTFPASRTEKFILHILPKEGRKEISARLDTLEELSARIFDVIRGNVKSALEIEEPVEEEARRLFRGGAEALAATVTGGRLPDVEEIFGGHDFFRSLLLPRLTGETQKEALRLGASYLFVNQLLFYALLSQAAQAAGPPFSENYPPIRASHFSSPKALRAHYFERVHSRNYEPIYGFDVAQFFKGRDAETACKDLVRGVLGLAPKLDIPDLVGQVFQTLIPLDIRKKLGAHYTNRHSAELLARLAVRTPRDTVLDPACGSGTLLVAAYRRKLQLAPEGDSASLHHRFVERDITGIDAMGFSAHLSAVNLALQQPLVETEHVRIGLADSTTKRPPGRAADRVPGSPLTVINPTETIVSREIRQAVLDQPAGVSKPRRRQRRVVQISSRDARPIPLEAVDLVIMNPPFTSWDNMGESYRENLKKSFANEPEVRPGFHNAIHWKTSQQSFFLLLGDLFLKSGGTVAAVLPVTTFTGQAFAPLLTYLLANYTIRVVVVGLGRSSFSEDTSLSECLFVATKGKAASGTTFPFVGVEKPPDQWTADEVDRIATAIETGVSIPGLVRIEKVAMDSMRLDRETLSGLTFRLHDDYAAARATLDKVYAASSVPLVPFGTLPTTTRRWNLGGGWLKHYGSRGLFVYRTPDRATKDSDRLLLDAEDADSIRFHDRMAGPEGHQFSLPRMHLRPALRSFSYLPGLDVTGRSDFVVARPSDSLRKVLVAEYGAHEGNAFYARVTRAVKRKGGGQWEGLIGTGFCKLAFAGRLNLAAKGTRALCVRSEEPMLLAAYGFMVSGAKDTRTEKLLSLWLNSTPFLLSLMDKLTITEGTWVRMEQFILAPALVPQPSALSEGQWTLVERLYAKLKSKPLPSLVDQLQGHPTRLALDDGVLHLLGITETSTRSRVGESIRKGALTGLTALRAAMGVGKKPADLSEPDSSGEDEPPAEDDDEVGTEDASADLGRDPGSESRTFGGQVSFGEDGKMKGTASLKNWKKN
jgi:N-6 DNA Methylase